MPIFTHCKYFNPRSLCRERLESQKTDDQKAAISIHAPYTGSDDVYRACCRVNVNFNPRSLYRERRRNQIKRGWEGHFNPRSLYRERLLHAKVQERHKKFQSTLPIQGATTPPADHSLQKKQNFNPRSLYRERRLSASDSGEERHFNPRSLYRERPFSEVFKAVVFDISIHAPYTGSDNFSPSHSPHSDNFNPRSLYRERHAISAGLSGIIDFNPRSLYRERPDSKTGYKVSNTDFNPRSLYRERQRRHS